MTTFANGTPTGFDATSNGAVAHFAGTADEIPYISGEEYTASFDMVLNSGGAPAVNLTSGKTGGAISAGGWQAASAGSNVLTFTASSTTTGVLNFRANAFVTDFEITNLIVYKT